MKFRALAALILVAAIPVIAATNTYTGRFIGSFTGDGSGITGISGTGGIEKNNGTGTNATLYGSNVISGISIYTSTNPLSLAVRVTYVGGSEPIPKTTYYYNGGTPVGPSFPFGVYTNSTTPAIVIGTNVSIQRWSIAAISETGVATNVYYVAEGSATIASTNYQNLNAPADFTTVELVRDSQPVNSILFMGGIGPNGASLRFPTGDSIYGQSFSDIQDTNDSGLSIGLNNGQILGERYSYVLGAFNDVAGHKSFPVIGAAILGGTNNVVGRTSKFGTGYTGSGHFSVTVGGANNYIGGTNSLASGSNINITNDNNFVYNDGSLGVFNSSSDNQATLVVSNGMRVFGKSITVSNANSWAILSANGTNFSLAVISTNASGTLHTNSVMIGNSITGNAFRITVDGTNVFKISQDGKFDAAGATNIQSSSIPRLIHHRSTPLISVTISSGRNYFAIDGFNNSLNQTAKQQATVSQPYTITNFCFSIQSGVGSGTNYWWYWVSNSLDQVQYSGQWYAGQGNSGVQFNTTNTSSSQNFLTVDRTNFLALCVSNMAAGSAPPNARIVFDWDEIY